MTRSVLRTSAMLGPDPLPEIKRASAPVASSGVPSTSAARIPGRSAVRSKYRSSAAVYQRTLDYLRKVSTSPVVFIMMSAIAKDLGVSTKSVQRDFRGMEEDGLIEVERQRRPKTWGRRFLSGVKVVFRRRVSTPRTSSVPSGAVKSSTARRDPALVCAERLLAASPGPDLQKLRRVRSKVLVRMLDVLDRSPGALRAAWFEAIGQVRNEWRARKIRGGAPSSSADLASEAALVVGIGAW
jgi:hypothetical protein